MKSSIFKYFFEILKVLIWPVIFLIGQFIINYLFTLAYSLNYPHLTLTELTENTMIFINQNKVIITFMSFVILLIIFLWQYKKNYDDHYIIHKNYIYLILFGIGYSVVINILFLNISITFSIGTSQFSGLEVTQFISTLLCSGLMGPILEEYLFRGIIYNKLKLFNNEHISILLTALIFSLLHGNLFNIINAFMLNYLLIFIYHKYRTLLAPIILHIAVNTTVVFIINIIISQTIYFNYFLFIIGIILIIISSVKIFYKQ